MGQLITYNAPAGVTSINFSDGSRAAVVGGKITADLKFRNELEAAGFAAQTDNDNLVRYTTNALTGGIVWTAAEFAAITPEAGKFYLVEA